MQIVATLGAFRMKSDEVVENSTIKHSIPCSARESDTIGMEIHSEVLASDITRDPLFSKKSVVAVFGVVLNHTVMYLKAQYKNIYIPSARPAVVV